MEKERIVLVFIGLLWITMWAVVLQTGYGIGIIWLPVPLAPFYGWMFCKYFLSVNRE